MFIPMLALNFRIVYLDARKSWLIVPAMPLGRNEQFAIEVNDEAQAVTITKEIVARKRSLPFSKGSHFDKLDFLVNGDIPVFRVSTS